MTSPHIWHPFTQMSTAPEPIEIVSASGPWLTDREGRKIFDGVSSWWVTVHGHAHPYIAKAIADQAATLEQVIFAGFTHPQANRLSERLVKVLPPKINKIFFSDDGSTAVEVGLKMAWQYWQNLGENKSRILALDNAYHGDTFGAMSVSGRSIFTKAFGPLMFDVDYLPSPSEADENALLNLIDVKGRSGEVAAMIVEPLIQGAGGMMMYSPALLDKMMEKCREHNILIIFDEVMTGFGRTGTLFASDQVKNKPDIICLSKGLTGGFLAMSITACTDQIYNAFLSSDWSKTLFHGHSFTANALGCAAANASLDLFEKQETKDNIARITQMQTDAVPRFQGIKGVENVRSTGTILAMNMGGGPSAYLDQVGPKLYQFFIENGALIRPLGNVLYLMPPYVSTKEELETVLDLMEKGVRTMMDV